MILLPGTAAIGLSTVLGATVVGRGQPILAMYVALIVTPFTVVMYATLIPSIGATGAALASTISYLGTFALWCYLYHRVTGRHVFRYLVPTRSEFDDLRALPRGAGSWIAGRRS